MCLFLILNCSTKRQCFKNKYTQISASQAEPVLFLTRKRMPSCLLGSLLGASTREFQHQQQLISRYYLQIAPNLSRTLLIALRLSCLNPPRYAIFTTETFSPFSSVSPSLTCARAPVLTQHKHCLIARSWWCALSRIYRCQRQLQQSYSSIQPEGLALTYKSLGSHQSQPQLLESVFDSRLVLHWLITRWRSHKYKSQHQQLQLLVRAVALFSLAIAVTRVSHRLSAQLASGSL